MEILLDFKYVYWQGPCRNSHSLMIQNEVVPKEKTKEISWESSCSFTVHF